MMYSHCKSFVIRNGKITTGQKIALSKLLPDYAISYSPTLKLTSAAVFGNNKPLVIEIGSGNGEATWQIAFNNPNVNYVAIEVHTPGIGALLVRLKDNPLTNLKIINYDAVMVVRDMLLPTSIDGFHIFFPDPWPKKRHHKRRLIQHDFVALLVSKLTIKQGYIHLATDWQDYALQMLEVLVANEQLQNILNINQQEGLAKMLLAQLTQENQVPNPSSFLAKACKNKIRPETKFERRALAIGQESFDLVFCRIK